MYWSAKIRILNLITKTLVEKWPTSSSCLQAAALREQSRELYGCTPTERAPGIQPNESGNDSKRPFMESNDAYPEALVVQAGTTSWQHTTCFEMWHGPDCCGCCDRGPCYILQHALCFPCSFGRMADKGAGYSCCLCCTCMTAAAPVAHAFGAPILPCAGMVRRKMVRKYGINETCPCSVLHIICCPGVSMLQMLMEVEDRENGRVGLWGEWDVPPVQAQQISKYEPPTADIV